MFHFIGNKADITEVDVLEALAEDEDTKLIVGYLEDISDGDRFVKAAEAVDNKLVVTLDAPETDNPALVRRLVEQGAAIQFVGELRHSLEDVYLRLIEDNA